MVLGVLCGEHSMDRNIPAHERDRPPARPLQNRVDPFGEFHAVSARGAMFGNRGGRLHDDVRRLTSAASLDLAALDRLRLRIQGTPRNVWGAGYTELFFLDEPTALAAGHRPCFECRRVGGQRLSRGLSREARAAPTTMDEVLHRERLDGEAQAPLAEPSRRAPPGCALVAIGGRASCASRRKAAALELCRLRRGARPRRRGCRRADAVLDRRRACRRISSALESRGDAVKARLTIRSSMN